VPGSVVDPEDGSEAVADSNDDEKEDDANSLAGSLLARLAQPSWKKDVKPHLETVKQKMMAGTWSLKDGFISHPPNPLSFTKLPDPRHYYQRGVVVWDPEAMFRHLLPDGIVCPNQKEDWRRFQSLQSP